MRVDLLEVGVESGRGAVEILLGQRIREGEGLSMTIQGVGGLEHLERPRLHLRGVEIEARAVPRRVDARGLPAATGDQREGEENASRGGEHGARTNREPHQKFTQNVRP